MKNVMKQKTFLAAISCFIAALAVALGMSLYQKPTGVISRIAAALETGDAQKYAECFVPEKQDEEKVVFYWNNMQKSNETIHVLYGDSTEIKDGVQKTNMIVLYNENDVCQDMEVKTFDITTINGELYIE